LNDNPSKTVNQGKMNTLIMWWLLVFIDTI